MHTFSYLFSQSLLPSSFTVDDDRLVPEKLLADEELSIVSAIRDTFLPRLGERDRSVFSSIILDLWPNVDVPLDFAGGHKDQVKDKISGVRLKFCIMKIKHIRPNFMCDKNKFINIFCCC